MPPLNMDAEKGKGKKKCLGYRLPGIVGAEMGEKGIFVGRIAVVFFFIPCSGGESLGIFFVSSSSLSF